MNINLSDEMIKVIARSLRRDYDTNGGGIEEGAPEGYLVDNIEAMELFESLPKEGE